MEEVKKEYCPQCNNELKEDRHGLVKFCSKPCKDKFHNEKKRENRLEADYFVSQLKKQELEKSLKKGLKKPRASGKKGK